MNFERGIDPKETLEIGMESVLEKFLEEHRQRTSKRHHQLMVATVHGRGDIMEYLILQGEKLTREHLQISVNRGRIDLIKLILKYDSSLKSKLSITQYKWKLLPDEVKSLIE